MSFVRTCFVYVPCVTTCCQFRNQSFNNNIKTTQHLLLLWRVLLLATGKSRESPKMSRLLQQTENILLASRFVSCARCLFVYVSLPLFFCFVHVRTLIMFNRTCMSGHEYTSSQIFFLSLHEKVEKHVCTFNLHV